MKAIIPALLSLFILGSYSATSQTAHRSFLLLGNVDLKAVKHFEKTYPNAVNEKWRVENGYNIVSFVTGDIRNKVVYTPDGRLDYSLKMYNEGQLPASIRKHVKSIYFDFDIKSAQELSVKNKTIYIAQLKDANSWKTVRVYNGDVEEIENYSVSISPCR